MRCTQRPWSRRRLIRTYCIEQKGGRTSNSSTPSEFLLVFTGCMVYENAIMALHIEMSLYEALRT